MLLLYSKFLEKASEDQRLHVDCCRIMREISHKGSLRHFRNPSSIQVKTIDFTTYDHFVSWLKKKKIEMWTNFSYSDCVPVNS